MIKNLIVGIAFLLASMLAFGQAGPIRGQVSDGVYVNVLVDSSGKLITTGTGSSPVTSASCATTSVTVTNSSQALVAANTSRKLLMIQNNHATAIVYLAFGATAATTSLATIIAGASIYFSTVVPTQAVNLIGSVASNATVAVLECS